MNNKELLELLNKLLDEIPHLKRMNYSNQEYKLWRYKISDTLEKRFGKKSEEFKRFTGVGFLVFNRVASKSERQQSYITDINDTETALKSIIQRQAIIRISGIREVLQWFKLHLIAKFWKWVRSHRVRSIVIVGIPFIAGVVYLIDYIKKVLFAFG